MYSHLAVRPAIALCDVCSHVFLNMHGRWEQPFSVVNIALQRSASPEGAFNCCCKHQGAEHMSFALPEAAVLLCSFDQGDVIACLSCWSPVNSSCALHICTVCCRFSGLTFALATRLKATLSRAADMVFTQAFAPEINMPQLNMLKSLRSALPINRLKQCNLATHIPTLIVDNRVQVGSMLAPSPKLPLEGWKHTANVAMQAIKSLQK